MAAAAAKLAELRRRYDWLDRLIRAGVRYQSRYGDHYAAAITYFSVLAMVPLLMIGFAVAGFVLSRNPELLTELRRSITTAVPNPQLSAVLNQVVLESMNKAGAVGIAGLLVALYSGLGWMTNLREALTAQWTEHPPEIPLLKKTVSDLLSLLGLGVALAISFGISALGGGVGRMVLVAFGVQRTTAAGIGFRALTIVLSLVASWLVFVWVLARLPRKPVTIRSAVWGALFAAVGFEILKQVVVLYLNTVTGSPSGAAFGPILGLLVFAYLTSRFVLFVTAWTASARENEEVLPSRPPSGTAIRPVVRVRERPSVASAVGLLGAGALLGWVFRNKRR